MINKDDFFDSGSQSVFLSTCLFQCQVGYKSDLKIISLFNKSSFIINIKNGLGNLEIYDINFQKNLEEEDIIDEVFDYDGIDFSEEISPEIQYQTKIIYNHIKKSINTLYSTFVYDLVLSFSIINKNNSSYISLIDVLKCYIQRPLIYKIVSQVPDGIDLISQFIIYFGNFDFSNKLCSGNVNCLNLPSIPIKLVSIMKYLLNLHFFDCDINEIFNYIKTILMEIRPLCFQKIIHLCNSCYHDWQLFETRLKNPILIDSPKKNNKSMKGNYFSVVTSSLTKSRNPIKNENLIKSTKVSIPKSQIQMKSIYSIPPFVF